MWGCQAECLQADRRVRFGEADGTLGHVTPASATVSNVAAYQQAGIKGPVTITYAEYLARGGAA